MARVMTISEVAEYLKVHNSTIYRLLKRGQLPGFKIGSDWRFDQREIDLWIENGGRKAAPNSRAAG